MNNTRLAAIQIFLNETRSGRTKITSDEQKGGRAAGVVRGPGY